MGGDILRPLGTPRATSVRLPYGLFGESRVVTIGLAPPSNALIRKLLICKNCSLKLMTFSITLLILFQKVLLIY